MEHKKYFVITSILLGLILIICTSCFSNKDQEPSFERMLVSTDSSDFTTYYVCDDTWDKKVKGIYIPDVDKSIIESCKVIDVLTCQDNMYCILWEIAFKKGQPEKNFSFDKIEVAWDDGIRQIAEIGHIEVLKTGKFSKFELLDATDRRIIETKKFDSISIEPEDSIQNLLECYDSITINGRDISDFKDGGTVEVEIGDKLEISTVYNEDNSEYHEVMVQLIVTCKSSATGEKEKVVCELFGHGPHNQEIDIELGEH